MLLTPEIIQIWVVHVAAEDNDRWTSLLSAGERERKLRFRMPADQKRFAVTRGILRTLLSHYLSASPTEIEFTTNENGKPEVVGDLRFNVAHSGNYSLLAFARNIELGVDVEHVRPDRATDDLTRRILTDVEYAHFQMLPLIDRGSTFFQIWTLKESVLKGIGSGLSIDPQCIEIAFHPREPSLLSSSSTQLPTPTDWSLKSLLIGDDDYAAAIAAKHRSPAIELKHFE